MPLIAENNFLPDYTNIDDSIAERAKLMFLNYPNNPTGATASKDFFDETIHFANKHNILVVHDFAYGAIDLMVKNLLVSCKQMVRKI